MEKITLREYYRDIVTGFEGEATAHVDYAYQDSKTELTPIHLYNETTIASIYFPDSRLEKIPRPIKQKVGI